MCRGESMKLRIYIFAVAALFFFQAASARMNSGPFGSPKAVRGGQLNLHTSSFPKSFNYLVNNSSDASEVYGLVYDTLLEVHPVTLEFMPLLAKSWKISTDKKVFTFSIDPDAKWADGKPVTAEDVKFTYDTIMNPSNLTSVPRLSMARFQPPVIVDANTVRFIAKTVHYNNLVGLASLYIIPKHLYAGKDFNKAFNMNLPSGSGPYQLSDVKEGRYYILKRRSDYWADKLPNHRGTYNFDSIKYKVIRDDSVAFEAFKKGDFDIFTDISAKRWMTETDGDKFKNNWVVKQKIYNHYPTGFSGIALNMRKAPFNDLRVRKALFMLLDRKTLLDKIMFNQYEPLNSYWPSLYASGETPNPPVAFNPEKAKNLLKDAGYGKLDREGYLVNAKGQRLEFSLLYSSEAFEKHLTFYADSLKQAGVKVKLELLSWATLLKKIEEFKFDAVTIGWSASLFEDPEQLWHSKHAEEPGGSDLPGYRNRNVDRIIDSLPPIFDAQKRNAIIRSMDRIIYRETPYILFWNASYQRLFYRNEFSHPATYLSKYGSTGDILTYWWFDSEKQKKLADAEKNRSALPAEKAEVYYDKLSAGQGN